MKSQKLQSHYRQLDSMDCGPTCLRMVAKHYGKHFNINRLRQQAQYSKEGVNLMGIAAAAENIGFTVAAVQITYGQLINEAVLPAILHWNQNHFVVIAGVQKKIFSKDDKIIIADPAEKGIISISKQHFLSYWLSSDNNTADKPDTAERTGIALLLEPDATFNSQEEDKDNKVGWGMLTTHLHKQRRFIIQLFLGLLIGSLLQLIFPFLTQNIVDKGINNLDINFIYLVLIAQFMLIFSRTIVEFVRARILLHISTRVNFALLSSFWIKLMKLPISYFDIQKTGDIQQRLNDQKRIEGFLTGTALSTMFSFFNLVVFSLILLQYNSMVFFIFSAGSALYIVWIRVFLRFRRNLDYKRFSIAAKENSATMQLIYGMQEIKLNNAERLHRWQWESLQAGLFKLQFKSLSLSQRQQAGAFFINEGKNILITFFVAKAVIDGYLSLGQMLAVQYILGQLSSPVEQLIGFTQQLQDAKISLERLNEIHQIPDEENDEIFSPVLPQCRNIMLDDVSFTYPGAGNEPALKNVSLYIPEGKVTAIVGMSGSGKTTLLKLLLRFYTTYSGKISLCASFFENAGNNWNSISPGVWRDACGSVMQDGYIFNDSIAKNIAVNDIVPDYKRLEYAAWLANILPFIDSLPLGFNTKIGAEGKGISAGQKQRILIARAVYKDPEFLFFDEATNALDANNEKVIIENLEQFFKGKTVVVVAHRLSTVKNADNIVVLENGSVIEQGTHSELAARKGKYFELVKNQLELGN